MDEAPGDFCKKIQWNSAELRREAAGPPPRFLREFEDEAD